MRFVKGLTPLALVLASTALLAQETTGTITGTVRNRAGQGIAGATVRLTSPKMLGERVVLTNEKGDYRVPIIPGGTFNIIFAAKGHLSNKGTAVLIAGQTLRQDAILPEEKVVGATVEVVSSVAQVDKTETVTQTNFNSEALESLGLMGAGGTDFVFGLVANAPGVSGTGHGASIRGGVGAGANITMNGGSVKSMVKNLWEMRVTIPDMVESMAVIQSPLNAKYGNTDGGTMAITTSHGSNDFGGTIRRVAENRGFWSTTGAWDSTNVNYIYGNKLSQNNTKLQLQEVSDNLLGEWNITLKGPIWKDHITFAYAGALQGVNAFSKVRAKSYSDVAQVYDTQSTYYKDPSTGTVIREAQLSPYDGQAIPQQTVKTWNQYNLYWQISTSHQLEYGYTEQFRSDNIENGAWSSFSWPGMTDGTYEQTRTIHNLGYKGVIGSSGVLEIRIASKKEAYVHATTDTPGIGTWIGQNNVRDGDDSSVWRPANNAIDLWLFSTPGLMEYGRSYGDHDTLSTMTDSINYQHILEFHGSHIIDVGISELGSKYDNQNVKALNFQTFGHIAANRGVDAAYADKFIVIPYNATVSDVIGGGDYNYARWGLSIPGDTLFRDASDISPLYIMTQMNKATGPTDGTFRSNTRSYYVNDQYTYDKHHSLMVGLRDDHFKFWDGVHTIHSYDQLQPRLEYKFDIKGDQSRIVNFSFGEFAETLHSYLFSPYAQAYLPYRTQQLWTGGADPSPNTANPNAPYLVTRAQLIDPANYTILPGSLASSSQAGGLSDQINPNLRGPVSREYTLGYRRSLDNGSYYRVTFVHKSWRHLYDYFPSKEGATQNFDQTYFPGVASTQVLPRFLADDPKVHRVYNSVELEWNFIFTRRASFGGNYTYHRLMANDSSSTMDNAMGLGKDKTYDRNWRDYLDTYVSSNERNPMALRSGGHTLHGWFTYDLSRNKVKQSVVLRGSYLPGSPYSNYSTYSIPTPTIANYNSTTYLPSRVQQYYDGVGRFSYSDSWNLDLHYSLELQVFKGLSWFGAIDIANVLNNAARSGYELEATAGSASWSDKSAVAHGAQISRDTRAAEGHFGFRTVTFETGLRF